MNAEIIGVGTELLLGQISNTNAQYISSQLAALGINVFYHTAVGDNKKRLLKVISIAEERSDIIITTGGLGPTADDITKETISHYLGLELVLHKASYEALTNFFSKLQKPMTPNNEKQALFPIDAIILPNDKGTAPGFILEKNDKLFIVLPGPPFELNHMFDNYVVSYLEKKSKHKIFSRTLRVFGIGESAVENEIKDIITTQDNPTVAPLAGKGEVTLRLTVKCPINDNPHNLIKPVEDKIRNKLGNYIYGVDNEKLEHVVARLLTNHNKKIAIAESCTGGYVSKLLTDLPGASAFFLEGIVTYSNESKIERLNVNKETLEKFGAVSCETVTEMTKGLVYITNADIALAITGIAGPSGGSDDKPVGLVFIGLIVNSKLRVEKFMFSGDRNKIRYMATKHALNLLRLELEDLNHLNNFGIKGID